MLSSHYYNRLTCILLFIIFVRNDECINIFLCQRFTYYSFGDYISVTSYDSLYFFMKFRVGVGIWMSNIYFIIGYFPAKLKTKLIIEPPRIFTRNLPLLIDNLLANGVPAHIIFLIIYLWKCNRHHPIIKKRIIFGKIHNVEGILHSHNHISHWEEKPLIIATGIRIILHHQVILSLWNLH